MSVRIGISPIAWQNDDLPDLTAGFTMDQAMREARELGYSGVERGRRMPTGTSELRDYLEAFGLALCGGWCSGNLLVRDVAEEARAIAGQVRQFSALDAPCLVYSECSNTVQGDRSRPLSRRPKLDRDAMADYGRKLGELAKRTAEVGLPIAYHHHMGSIVQDGDDIDRLMEATPPDLTLCYDTGHLLFGGANVLGVLDRWGDRVGHVHVKDVRAEQMQAARAGDASFLDAVVAGVFTVPGDGCIDFAPVIERLAAMDYSGWIVIEAEQDPAKSPPRDASRMGHDHIATICASAGIVIAS